MELYGVPLRIQSECGKIRTRITLNTDTFYAVNFVKMNCFTKRQVRVSRTIQMLCIKFTHRILQVPPMNGFDQKDFKRNVIAQ